MTKVAKVLKKRQNDLSIEKFTEYFPNDYKVRSANN